jgi:hypothetical protein
MTCVSCHASWALQEYGTFLIEVEDEEKAKAFQSLQNLGGGYFKGSYLKEYGPPPLGRNEQGLYSPIRPEFIFFHTKVDTKKRSNTKDNVLLGAFWKAFSPHTIRKETPLCPSCHNDPKRFLHADPSKEVYNLKRDGLPFGSFFRVEGQELLNGTFVDEPTLRRRILIEGTLPYARLLVEKWSRVLKSLP